MPEPTERRGAVSSASSCASAAGGGVLGGAGVFGGAVGFAGFAAVGLAAGGGAVFLLVSGWMPLAMETPFTVPSEIISGAYQKFPGHMNDIGDPGASKLEMPTQATETNRLGSFRLGLFATTFADRRPKGCFGPVRAVTAGDCVGEWVPFRFAGV
jgi:hypothetical protein